MEKEIIFRIELKCKICGNDLVGHFGRGEEDGKLFNRVDLEPCENCTPESYNTYIKESEQVKSLNKELEDLKKYIKDWNNNRPIAKFKSFIRGLLYE